MSAARYYRCDGATGEHFGVLTRWTRLCAKCVIIDHDEWKARGTPRGGEGGDAVSECKIWWQGPSDLTCTDDLLVINCALERGHDGRHLAPHPDSPRGRIVLWDRGTGDLLDAAGNVVQPQFAPEAGVPEPPEAER